jgi:hypothetical protein
MRELNTNELEFVSGGLVCTEGEVGNSIHGISQPEKFGDYLISIYEGAIQATSYMFERVANAF